MIIRKIKSYPPMLWLLSVGVVINLTVMSFLWLMTTIYVDDVLEKSLPMAGLVLLLQQAGAMLGNLAEGFYLIAGVVEKPSYWEILYRL